jgi:anthranilate phosphoribosyltransferase
MIKQSIHKLVNFENLTPEEMTTSFNEIMSGETTDAQISSFITALRMKGETIDEITAATKVLRDKANKLYPKTAVFDIVGTGGDEVGTFNISTITSLVISAAGVKIAKHGNRAVSSKTGSADVLEALGVKIDIPVEKSEHILETLGICFMFAPNFHPSMKYAAPVRKETGIRSIFNILGPLSNPANATGLVLGVYDKELLEPLGQVLINLGMKTGMVIHGSDGLDEITMTGPTYISEIDDGLLKSYTIKPEDFGFERCKLEDLIGGDPEFNAQIARDILDGKKGPKRDTIILNAALCLHLHHKDKHLADCVEIATETIDSGKALSQLNNFIEMSKE